MMDPDWSAQDTRLRADSRQRYQVHICELPSPGNGIPRLTRTSPVGTFPCEPGNSFPGLSVVFARCRQRAHVSCAIDASAVSRVRIRRPATQ